MTARSLAVGPVATYPFAMRFLDRLVSFFRPRPVLRPEMFHVAPSGTASGWQPSIGTMTVRDDHFEFLTEVGWVHAAELCRRAGLRVDQAVPIPKMVELARAYRG